MISLKLIVQKLKNALLGIYILIFGKLKFFAILAANPLRRKVISITLLILPTMKGGSLGYGNNFKNLIYHNLSYIVCYPN